MTLYKNKYRVESTRLQKWDYGWNAKYFITIVTKNREHYFGNIDGNKKMNLTETGKIASEFWHKIPNHIPFVLLDEFVVMPNHIHGIAIIDKKHGEIKNIGGCNVETRHALSLPSSPPSSTRQSPQPPSSPQPPILPPPSFHKLTPGQKQFRNPGNNNISSIIGSYKSIVSNNAHKINPNFDWQSRFLIISFAMIRN
jgi:REP element-mobilizing transposase RayT